MQANPQEEDEKYMQRALDLAQIGRGKVSPNPMVGAVIVHQQQIIGEGWHQRYGQAHAEVNAVQSVADPSLLKNASIYVNLEPCAHYGKTPPCVDLLIQHQFCRVVVANLDPNPLVAGKGLQKLREVGIEVKTGVLEEKGRQLNRRFFKFFEKKWPYVILKWAETADGFIAREDYDSKWISEALSRTLVHKWRTEEDAILVGTNTAHYDNPQLNARHWTGKHPLRVVIDRNLRLSPNLYLFDRKQNTLCYNFIKEEKSENLEYVLLKREENLWLQIWEDLHERQVQSLLVEGGTRVLSEILHQNLADEARIFKSSQTFDKGIPAPVVSGRLHSVKKWRNDWLFTYDLRPQE